MDVSEIKDSKSFESWLMGKPIEWSQAIAARIALRVAPLGFSVAALPEEQLAKDYREYLTLLTFRANFISSADRKYTADDMSANAFKAAYAAKAANAFNAVYAAKAAYAAIAAANATNTTVIATAIAAAKAAANAARTAADAAAHAAMNDAAFRTAADAGNAATNTFWSYIRADCAWLEFSDNRLHDNNIPSYEFQHKHKTLAAELSRHSLWVDGFDERGKIKAADMPEYILENFNVFSNSELAKKTSFGFIVDWYKGLNTYNGRADPKNVLTQDAELAIAKMSEDDWGDNDEERDCIAVMDRVAKLAGWGRGSDGVDGEGDLEQFPATVKTVWNDGKLGLDKTPVTSIHPDDVALDDLQSLIPEMKDLVDKLSALGNVDKMPAEYLAKTIELIPDSFPDRAQVFRLARRLAGLDDFKSIIADQCSDSIARLFNSIVDQFRQSLDQFSDRRSFNRKMLQLDFEELDNDEVKSDVEYQLDVMRSDKGAELIRDEVPDTIELIDNSEDGSIVGDNSVQKYKTVDQLESLSNILKSLAVHSKDEPKSKELFDKMIEAYDTNFEEGLVEGAAEAGKNDGRKAGKAITRTDKGIKLSKPLRRRLAQKYPKFFGWLDK